MTRTVQAAGPGRTQTMASIYQPTTQEAAFQAQMSQAMSTPSATATAAASSSVKQSASQSSSTGTASAGTVVVHTQDGLALPSDLGTGLAAPATARTAAIGTVATADTAPRPDAAQTAGVDAPEQALAAKPATPAAKSVTRHAQAADDEAHDPGAATNGTPADDTTPAAAPAATPANPEAGTRFAEQRSSAPGSGSATAPAAGTTVADAATQPAQLASTAQTGPLAATATGPAGDGRADAAGATAEAVATIGGVQSAPDAALAALAVAGSTIAPTVSSDAAAVQGSTPPAAAQAEVPNPVAQVEPALLSLASSTDGSSRMSLTLHPKDLGGVTIQLDRATDGTVSVTVSATEPSTLRSLMADQGHLHAALDAASIPAADRQLTFALAQAAPVGSDAGTGSTPGDPGLSGQGSGHGYDQNGGSPGQDRGDQGGQDGPALPSAASFDDTSAGGTTRQLRFRPAGINITA